MIEAQLGTALSKFQDETSLPRDGLSYRVEGAIRTVNVFENLGVDAISAFTARVQTTTAPAGRTVYEPDLTGEGLFVLLKGRAQIYSLSPGGKRVIVADVEPGGIFGDMPFIGHSMHGTFVETTEDSAITVLSQNDLQRIIGRFPEIGLRLAQLLIRRLGNAETLLEDFALKPLAPRLATFLLRRTSPESNSLRGVTHQDLGELVAAARETVTSTLNCMKRRGLINLGRRRINVLDRDQLLDLAESY